MKVLPIDYSYSGEYTVDNIFAMNQHWENGFVFSMHSPRPTSALLYAKGCKLEYTLNGKELFVKTGEIIYIPQGSIYKTKFSGTEKDKTGTVLIEFTAALPGGEPFVFFPEPTVISGDAEIVSEYFAEMVRLFKAPVPSPALKKSILYRTLSAIGYVEKTHGLFMNEFAPIANGILYMENDIDQKKSIEEIAELCHVSTSYFRKLFRKYSGMSPIEYQIQVKIRHAKQLLQTNTMRVAEVAEALGFSDPAYFCRLFKKNTGLSPKEYAKKK